MTALLVAVAYATTPLERWTFDANDEGFVHGGSPDLWQWGTPDAEPGACFGGACWCTSLDGDYATDSHDTLNFAPLDLTDTSDAHLMMAHWYDIDAGGDYGQLQVDGGGGVWTALAPTYGHGTDSFTGSSGGWRIVYFDLSGVTNLGLVRLLLETDDAVNRPGWCVDDVQVWDGDIVPPYVEPTVVPVDTQDIVGPYEMSAAVVDDELVASAVVHWSDGSSKRDEPMTPDQGDSWSIDFPQVPAGTTISWWIEASDATGNVTAWPESGTASFRVYLAAPTNLQASDGRLVGTTVPLSWDPPTSPHPVSLYRIYRDGVALLPDVAGTSAIVEMPVSDAAFEVAAIYSTLDGLVEGDPSASLDVSIAIPTLDPLVPDRGWPGDTLRVELTGVYLELVDGDVTLELGEGVSVGPGTVTDVDRATFDVAIDDDAEPGPRIAHLVSGDLDMDIPAAFEIEDGTDRPALTKVAPDSIRQGGHDTIVVTLNHRPAGVPVVDLGDGLVIESTTVQEDEIALEVTALADAPLGERSIVVDDGQRILEGLEFTVRDQAKPADTNCATGHASGTAAVLAACALALARRSKKRPTP